MNKIKLKKTLVLSFALFSMFFGASNVFLPSYIGLRVADNFLISSIGFLITGVGIPLLTLILIINNKGSYDELFKPMGKVFGNIFLIVSTLSIGPIIAIPRTASTAFEMGIEPFFPGFNKTIFLLIFFIICILFCFNENNVVDEIGKYLTPILIGTIVVLIMVGIFNVDKSTVNKTVESNPFMYSFLEGYHTLDALAAVIFARFIYTSIKDEENPVKLAKISSIIAATLLFLIFLGLMYAGKTANIKDCLKYERTAYMVEITRNLLGYYGKLALSIIVSLACITTAIGITASAANFFENLLKKRVSYKQIVLIIVIISIFMAQFPVDIIIKIAVPILYFCYPILIVTVVLSSIKSKYINNKVIRNSVYVTAIFTILKYLVKLPLVEIGLEWLIPTIIVFVLSTVYYAFKINRG